MTTSDNGAKVRLSDVIAPSFVGLHKDIKAKAHTHYLLSGGRGSCKSSFASAEIVLGIMNDGTGLSNALVMRKVASTISTSVFTQIAWAIDKLGVGHLWSSKVSPYTFTYTPTGQQILFRGADNPRKLKSIKVKVGYIKYVWYEECDEFTGIEEIDTINQSALRGGHEYVCFYSYNPPKSSRNWVNSYFAEIKAGKYSDRTCHHSDYRAVPVEWLGEQFLIEAEHMKENKPEQYRHDFLGEITGTNAEVFRNITLRPISDEEIKGFDKIYRGLDWGYGADPFAYIALHYSKTTRTIYIYYEFYKCGAKYDTIAAAIRKENKLNQVIRAESAEPRSNDELIERGFKVHRAKKGPGSVEHGINWLQDLDSIVIDPVRCPNTAREFIGYELVPDGLGGFRDGFPDRDNHSIDAVRYALEDITAKRMIKIGKKSSLGIY